MFRNEPPAFLELGLRPLCQPSSIWKTVIPSRAAFSSSWRQKASFTFES